MNSTTPTHIDIGGIALPREELAQVLPDIERFEQHLPDALAVDRDMKASGGAVPDYVRQWPQARIDAVVRTLKEVGSLREQASEQMQSAGAGRSRH
ncbi:hypothetical protein C84B14_17128 [Salinisphaera sp. C84B14]|uniref:hypothetical protein n=1 Tax=Salinisphaera sp. C84B14 TaxID=1304155 RepID=UPI0032B14B82